MSSQQFQPIQIEQPEGSSYTPPATFYGIEEVKIDYVPNKTIGTAAKAYYDGMQDLFSTGGELLGDFMKIKMNKQLQKDKTDIEGMLSKARNIQDEKTRQQALEANAAAKKELERKQKQFEEFMKRWTWRKTK
jgi:hypothetical protein